MNGACCDTVACKKCNTCSPYLEKLRNGVLAPLHHWSTSLKNDNRTPLGRQGNGETWEELKPERKRLTENRAPKTRIERKAEENKRLRWTGNGGKTQEEWGSFELDVTGFLMIVWIWMITQRKNWNYKTSNYSTLSLDLHARWNCVTMMLAWWISLQTAM